MNWIIAVPLAASAGATALKLSGKEISWFWVCLPLLGVCISMAGVLFLAGIKVSHGFLGTLQMLVTFLAVPATTVALIVKMIRVAL